MTIKVSGITFIKNGLTLGYPIAESIKSIEPLCDEVIINVGFDVKTLDQDDGTYQYLKDQFTSEKFVFLKSYWDPQSTKNGLILSEQTNIALANAQGKYVQYIQGDEIVHEDDLTIIKSGIDHLDLNPETHGLIFDYLHFYGNVDAFLHTRRVYRREIRLIRNHVGIKSHLDAQGFRHLNNQKVVCYPTKARIFHYGWARKEKVMANKIKIMDRLYHGSDFEKKSQFSYKKVWGIKKFLGQHPQVMSQWIKQNKNELDIHSLPLQFGWKDVGLAISDFIESTFGFRVGEYKNFIIQKQKS
jgi:glycosyltransferase involved in cell wall biosynthesis